MLLTTLLGVALLITSGDGLSGDQTAPPRIQAPSHVGGTPEDVLRPPAPIRVLSTSASIDFPDELVLRLEAESDSRIERIRVDYQIGGQTVRTYGYPKFTPSKRVSADFVIETDGARYLPSGADIAYSYTIENAAGSTVKTNTLALEYKDPSKEWERVQQGNLIVLYHDLPSDEVDRAARDVAERIERVNSLLGIEVSRPQKAVIFNSSSEARRSFPVVSDRATREHLYGGFAYGDYDLFIMVGLNRSTMVHEMTHLLLDEAVDSPFAVIPAWLNEGLAMYFEPRQTGRGSALLSAARRGELMRLRNMGSIPGRPRDVSAFYAQSRSVVRFMMDSYGEDRMAALLKAIDGGHRIERAVQETYGMSLDELEREWRVWLAGSIPGVR